MRFLRKMLYPLFFLIFINLAVVLQMSLLSGSVLRWFSWLFPITGIIWLALEYSLEEGGFLTFIVGYTTELHMMLPHGVCSLSFIILFFIVQFLAKAVEVKLWWMCGVFAAIGVLIIRFTSVIFIFFLKSNSTILWSDVFQSTLLLMICNGFLSMVVYQFFVFLDLIVKSKTPLLFEEGL